MEPTTTLALAKLLEKLAETSRTQVKPGSYDIDETVTLRVVGKLSVLADTEYTPTTSIPWKTTLALFVRYCGITRESALEALTQAMLEALEADKDAAEVLAAVTDLEAAEAQVQASLDKLPPQARKGAVSAKGAQLKLVDAA